VRCTHTGQLEELLGRRALSLGETRESTVALGEFQEPSYLISADLATHFQFAARGVKRPHRLSPGQAFIGFFKLGRE